MATETPTPSAEVMFRTIGVLWLLTGWLLMCFSLIAAELAMLDSYALNF